MRKLLVLIITLVPFFGFTQFGIKAGYNYANVTSASSINHSSRSGYLAGIIIAPQSKKILSYTTEFTYSRQGYDFANDTNTGNVNLDYIISAHLLCINITRFFSVQLGGQVAYLINAKADSTSKTNSMSGPYSSALSYYNQFDYGFAGGVEAHPVLGLLIGARYNISLAKLYKSAYTTNVGQPPSFASIDAKNNVVQVYAGWRFGKGKSNKKK